MPKEKVKFGGNRGERKEPLFWGEKMQAMAKGFTAAFKFRNSTKRTYRFEEEGGEQNIQTLYVQQRAFSSQPKKIRVTVEVVE